MSYAARGLLGVVRRLVLGVLFGSAVVFLALVLLDLYLSGSCP